MNFGNQFLCSTRPNKTSTNQPTSSQREKENLKVVEQNAVPIMSSEELTRNILRENHNHALDVQSTQKYPMDTKNSETENRNVDNNASNPAKATKSPAAKKVVRTPLQLLPITNEEFLAVSSLIRGRCTLEAVNQVYEAMFKYYKSRREKGTKSLDYLTPRQLTTMGCKVTGVTGEAKLSVLRNLGVIEMNKQGVRLFPTPIQKQHQ